MPPINATPRPAYQGPCTPLPDLPSCTRIPVWHPMSALLRDSPCAETVPTHNHLAHMPPVPGLPEREPRAWYLQFRVVSPGLFREKKLRIHNHPVHRIQSPGCAESLSSHPVPPRCESLLRNK